MAVNSTNQLSTDFADDDFDPFSPLEIYPVHPVWTMTPSELARVGELSYDRMSDTLYITCFPDDYRGGVMVEVGDERFVRSVITDMETDVVVALRIEGLLTQAVKKAPVLFDELERTDLRGITIKELADFRRRVSAEGHGPGPTPAEFYAPEAWLEPVVDENEGTR